MDIRVKKTKRAIQKAFVALLREKPIEKITVKEIAERAEINKTTFYSHSPSWLTSVKVAVSARVSANRLACSGL